jgi:hypothetical protein
MKESSKQSFMRAAPPTRGCDGWSRSRLNPPRASRHNPVPASDAVAEIFDNSFAGYIAIQKGNGSTSGAKSASQFSAGSRPHRITR